MKRLFKYPAFTTGFIIIAFFVVLAIPGYLITPDNSTDCNDIIPQIAKQKPGFETYYLRNKNNQQKASQSWVSIWLHGRENNGSAIPVKQNITLRNDTVYAFTVLKNEPIILPVNALEKNGDGYLFHRKFRLGTDRFGRDVLSRLIIGARVSLYVGFVAVIISLFIGILIGLFAGYSKGITDGILSWLIAVFWSIPTLLIALGLSFVFGKGISQVLVAVGLSTWVEVARVVRGQTMQLREKEFILAARITGFSTLRILFRHILPNLKGSLTVMATTNFAAAILLEAGLSFLGLGIAPPAASWGIMVYEHRGDLMVDTAYLALIPGAAIMLLVMGFNLVSMGLRDAFDTQTPVSG